MFDFGKHQIVLAAAADAAEVSLPMRLAEPAARLANSHFELLTQEAAVPPPQPALYETCCERTAANVSCGMLGMYSQQRFMPG